MKKILLSSGIITFMAGSLALGGTGAFFSDTETSTANTFAAGAIDLKIDNTSYYNGVFNQDTSWQLIDLTVEKFFNFLDLKPGDFGEDTISIHVDTNDAYICADVTLTSNDDNGLTEPEALVDQTGSVGEGELAQNVNFIWWADDGDNVLEVGEEVISEGPIGNLSLSQPISVALADSETNIWDTEPGPVPGDETVYIGKAWCFGNLSISPEVQDGNGQVGTPGEPDSNGPDVRGEGFTCDGSLLGNNTQTDSLTADVTFSAVQARHNQDFVCEVDTPPVPIVEACGAPTTQKWADSVVFLGQGLRKNNTAVLANRSNPLSVLGPAQTTGTPSDSGFPTGSFLSLGFVTQSSTSSIVVSFDDNVILNEAGADLRIYEVTGGTYPDEHVKVEGSKDGLVWTLLSADAVRDEDIDLGALDWAKYVRISDITNPAPFEAEADAYDLDALEAIHCGQLTN